MKNLYQIREVSVLSFNERVLQEAEDSRNPLLERLKFLGIFSSNMDEFFKVRVASIQRRIELGRKKLEDVLEIIGDEARELDDRFQLAYAAIIRGLAAEGIRILDDKEAAKQPREATDWLRAYFLDEVLPTVVPIILDRGQPFPQLTDGALYFGVKMWGDRARFAILELPRSLPRFIETPGGNIMYLEDVIRFSLDEIFYIFDYDRIAAYAFKVSRDAELDIDNDFSEGYVRKMQKVLRQRKGGRPTRLHYDATMPRRLLRRIMVGCHISDEDTLIGGGRYHNMKDLMRFPAKHAELMFPVQEPARHPVLDNGRMPMLDVIAQQDLLLTYPYQKFDHVVRLLREAAIDPRVESIKISLYRAATDSQVINALVNAVRNGKKVVASIELQARFDEQNNIRISERLTEAGATVLYGLPPRKVHSKLLLIDCGKSRYAGLSTGNFNEVTGDLYVDSMYFTADRGTTRDIAQVFDYFEGVAKDPNTPPPRPKRLIVSPFNTRKRLNRLIAREKARGSEGYIFLKVNHLTDENLVKRIHAAAGAGATVDLVVRTTYAVPQHENIHAVSILDRYLEHQRVYIFGKGEDREVYLSSADLMERNIDWRVEAAFPILDPALQQEVVDMMLLQLADTSKARVLDRLQTNRYIGNGGNENAAQYTTWRYFRRLPAQSPAISAASSQISGEDAAARP